LVDANQAGLNPDEDPVLEEPLPNDSAEAALRAARRQRHDDPGGFKLLAGRDYGCLEEPPPTPDLPIERSDLVAVASVVSYQPCLNENGSDIFTELTLCVERVLARKHSVPAAQGHKIILQRPGGALRLRSGGVIRKRCVDIGESPRPGHRYLLFLRYHAAAQVFSIVGGVSGYELRETRAIPLRPEQRVTTEADILRQAEALSKNR
jgi:hypothetical protein